MEQVLTLLNTLTIFDKVFMWMLLLFWILWVLLLDLGKIFKLYFWLFLAFIFYYFINIGLIDIVKIKDNLAVISNTLLSIFIILPGLFLINKHIKVDELPNKTHSKIVSFFLSILYLFFVLTIFIIIVKNLFIFKLDPSIIKIFKAWPFYLELWVIWHKSVIFAFIMKNSNVLISIFAIFNIYKIFFDWFITSIYNWLKKLIIKSWIFKKKEKKVEKKDDKAVKKDE